MVKIRICRGRRPRRPAFVHPNFLCGRSNSNPAFGTSSGLDSILPRLRAHGMRPYRWGIWYVLILPFILRFPEHTDFIFGTNRNKIRPIAAVIVINKTNGLARIPFHKDLPKTKKPLKPQYGSRDDSNRGSTLIHTEQKSFVSHWLCNGSARCLLGILRGGVLWDPCLCSLAPNGCSLKRSKRKSLPHRRFNAILLFILSHFCLFVKHIFIICFRKFPEIAGKFAKAEFVWYNRKNTKLIRADDICPCSKSS